MSDNPLSLEPYSRYSSKYRETDFDPPDDNYHDIPTLDESWPN